MGPVDENKEVFSLDCYFRQSWVDERLKYYAPGWLFNAIEQSNQPTVGNATYISLKVFELIYNQERERYHFHGLTLGENV